MHICACALINFLKMKAGFDCIRNEMIRLQVIEEFSLPGVIVYLNIIVNQYFVQTTFNRAQHTHVTHVNAEMYCLEVQLLH